MMVVFIFKAFRKISEILKGFLFTPFAKIIFFLNGVVLSSNLKVHGIVKVHVTRRGSLVIGQNLTINSGNNYNIIGRQQKTIFWVEGKVNIGNNVGMSSTAIICNHEIEIGNYVTIGGNTVIYDTDFHSLDSSERADKKLDKLNAKSGKVKISDNVFIGAHSTILKGVTIGENAIIGACSVITKDIPANEIWAGNPAKFIKKIVQIEI
jgi:acetyltransferase-like isoleucine patch superfamily enzyme